MELNEILNILLGGGLVAALVALATLRATVREANAKAERALADAETVKITNTESATKVLIENIVEPLKNELNETRKELHAVKREIARFRKAVDSANSCRYHDGCPVLERMREQEKERGVKRSGDGSSGGAVARGALRVGQRARADGSEDGSGDGADVVGESEDSDGQPA